MLVVIKGAGDLATGVAVRLHHAGFSLVMTELLHPTAIRRTVCLSRAIAEGTATVEDVTARYARDPEEAIALTRFGYVAVLADPEAACIVALRPAVVVDAILAKRNTGTRLTDAPVVIGLGPGFLAGTDCHAVVETMRGHDLGRVFLQGAAMANTGVPGVIGGYAEERILRAPCDGVWKTSLNIGAHVEAGQTIATVGESAVQSQIAGVLRGILPDGTPVTRGMKSGDVDPRDQPTYCLTVSDKARAIGGGVLEAILRLHGGIDHE